MRACGRAVARATLVLGALATRAHADPPIAGANLEHVETIAIGVPGLVTFTGATLVALALDDKLKSRAWPAIGLGLVFVGPSLGQLYLHRIQSTGLALRLAGFAVGAIGVRSVVTNCGDRGEHRSCTRGGVITAIGVVAVLVGSVLEIHAGYAHARDAALTPSISLAVTGTGVGVVGRF